MTQRYAGMLRRNAVELDKQDMPVQAECLRQAARHMEELQAAKDALEKDAARLDYWRRWWLSDGEDNELPAALMHADTSEAFDAAIDAALAAEPKRGSEAQG